MKKLLALVIVSLFIVFSSGAAMAIEEVGGEVETTGDEDNSNDNSSGEAEGEEKQCRDADPKTPLERLKYRLMCGGS